MYIHAFRVQIKMTPSWTYHILISLAINTVLISTEGECPSDKTPVVDLCSPGQYNGYLAYIDSSRMGDGQANCTCGIFSEKPQMLTYNTVIGNHSLNCDYYKYSLFNSRKQSTSTWVCLHRYGFDGTNGYISSTYPWDVSLVKTPSGLDIEGETPGFCLLLLGVKPIRIECYGSASSSVTSITTTQTSATTSTTGTSDITTTGDTARTTAAWTASDVSTLGKPGEISQRSTNLTANAIDTGYTVRVGLIAVSTIALLFLCFAVGAGLIFCRRRHELKHSPPAAEDANDDVVSIKTTTTANNHWPYRQPGEKYVYFLDTSTVGDLYAGHGVDPYW